MPSFLLKVSSKKFLSYFFVLIVMIGIFAPNTKINAYVSGEPCDAVGTGPNDPQDGKWVNLRDADGNNWVCSPTESAAELDKAVNPPNDSCGLFSLDQCLLKALTWIAFAIMGIMAVLLRLAGLLLDFVIGFTILDMQQNISGLTGINIGWKVIRDLINIAFIFLLVYEGIKMIIGFSDLVKVRKFISMVVLASLLVNFSLFFTKVMIDASNIVTIGIYNSLIEQSVTSPGATASGGGLSISFMKALGVSEFYSATSFDTLASNAGGNMNLLIMGLMGSVVFLIVSFVFFAISCMLVIRYITLIILLMLSPIAYMGMALPQIKTYADDWWKALNSQLLFAPIYMIMTLVILTLMGSPGFISKQGSWANLISPGGGGPLSTSMSAVTGNSSMSLIFNFAVIIGLTIASLVIAKKTSTQGSQFIAKATGSLTAAAGGVMLGGAAALGRRTIGAGANATANDQGLKDRAAGIGVNRFQQMAAQAKLKTARTVAAGSFDARRSGVGEMIASQTGVSLGKGTEGVPFLGNAKAGQGGRAQAIKDREKAEKTYYEGLKPSKEAEEKYRIEAQKAAHATLANPEEMERIKKEEVLEREQYYIDHPEELMQVQREVREAAVRLQEQKEVAATDETKAATAVEATKAQIASAGTKVQDAKDVLAAAKTRESQAAFLPEYEKIEAAKKVKEAEEALKIEEDKEKANRESLERQLKEEEKMLERKKKAHIKVDEEIAANEKRVEDEKMKHRSPEMIALEADAAGKGRTLHQERGAAYAASIEKSTTTRIVNSIPWLRGTGLNSAAAAAVRDSMREESDEKKLAKLAIKVAKANEEKEGGEEKTPTPPVAAATPTPPPAPTTP
jgi:hypothetical protein